MRLGSAVLRSILQQNATILISFGSGIVIARLLSPAEFGAYSVAVALLFVVMALKDFGVGSYVISDSGKDETLLASAYGLSLAMSALLTTLLICVSWQFAKFYNNDVLGQVLRIAAFSPLVLAIVFPATVLLTRSMRFDALLVIGVSGAAVQAIVSISLALLGYGPVSLGWGYLAGSVATAIVTFLFGRDMAKARPSIRGWRRLIGFSGWMSATLAVGSASTSTPQLVIGRVMGLGDAALFARAHTIVSLVLNAFFFAVTRPMLAGLAAAEHRDGNIAPLYLRIVEAVTGLAWPAYAALCIWAVPLVSLLYGQAWAAAGAMILPMVIGHALSLSVAPHHDVLIVKRRPALLFASELAIFVAALAALLLLLPLGLSIALWALAFSGAFFAVWYFFTLKNVVGFSAQALFAVWSRSLLLTVITLPAHALFRQLHADGVMPFLPAFFLAAVTAGVLWLVAIRLCRHELGTHVNPIFERILRPFREVGRGQA
ncbi:MAG: oligosaccharide flippase family protein [Beijerinckiaceae bacterium]